MCRLARLGAEGESGTGQSPIGSMTATTLCRQHTSASESLICYRETESNSQISSPSRLVALVALFAPETRHFPPLMLLDLNFVIVLLIKCLLFQLRHFLFICFSHFLISIVVLFYIDMSTKFFSENIIIFHHTSLIKH